ncbi:MAG: DUF1508 domain-containing protein [Eubacteriales bacterium]|nr:DUF1508 domain-containing protein [Eubacteriales bacterium]
MYENSDIMEYVTEIVAASVEDAGISIDEESGKKVAEFFNAILKGIKVPEEEKVTEVSVDDAEDQTAEAVEDENAGYFEIFKDSGDKYRFVLKNNEGAMLTISNSYEDAASCRAGIDELKAAARNAAVTERQ